MNALKTLLTAFVAIGMLSACAKKDSDFKAKYANANGAGSGNAANAAASDSAVDSTGVMIDVLSLTSVAQPAATAAGQQNSSFIYGSMSFTANLLVGSQYSPITIKVDQASTAVSGQTTIGSYNVNVYAECINTNCDPMYLQVDSYQSSQPKIEMGYMFRRFEEASSDRYTRVAAPFKSFADMITYLNGL